MRVKLVALLILMVAVTVPVAPTSAAEGVDHVVPLPWGIAPNGSHLVDSQHVYVPLHDKRVLVLDHDGNTVTTVDIGGYVQSISLTADGSTLWVTSSTAAIAYDTATFDEEDRVPFADPHCPSSAVETGGYLVWSNTCDPDDDPTLSIVDLTGDRTPFHSDADVPDGFWLGVSPTHPTVIAGMSTELDAELWTAEITGTTAELVSSVGAVAREPAIDPLGGRVVAAEDSDPVYEFNVYELPALEVVGSYPSLAAAPYPRNMTFSGDGQWFATATTLDGGVTYLLYERDGEVPVWQYTLEDVHSEGIRLSEDGSVLFAVAEQDSTNELHIVDIDLANPPSPLPTLPGSISGRITDPDGRGVDLGHVDVLDSAKNYLFTEDASSSGYYSIADLEPGSYHLIMWNGDNETIYYYFPQWYAGSPLYRSDLATPIEVSEDQDVMGVNVTLPWLYDDMFDSVFLSDIYWLGNAGITKGCNPPDNYLFCPDEYVTRGQMAAFINRAFTFDVDGVEFLDDDDSIFEADIERLAGAGITKGCNPPVNDHFCPYDFVTRGQMAAFMSRVFELADRGDTDFLDDNGSVFEADIERLAEAGITKGCNPPVNDRFCPDAYVTRGQMAAFFHRGFENVIFTADGVASSAATAQAPSRDPLDIGVSR